MSHLHILCHNVAGQHPACSYPEWGTQTPCSWCAKLLSLFKAAAETLKRLCCTANGLSKRPLTPLHAPPTFKAAPSLAQQRCGDMLECWVCTQVFGAQRLTIFQHNLFLDPRSWLDVHDGLPARPYCGIYCGV